MTLSVLISTIDQGLQRVPDVILPPLEGVEWGVSVQYTTPDQPSIPPTLTGRKDVKVSFLQGKGLSRNRNHALTMASGDLCLIADDDNRYRPEYFQRITTAFGQHPEADMLCFQSEDYDGQPMKRYPTHEMPLTEAFRQGYSPFSIELVVRRDIGIRFDERFGLGSAELCAGEEDVFIKDAHMEGKTILFIPEVIVRSRHETTADRFLSDPKVQLTKGATFRHLFGTREALWRTLKEALWWMVHREANPVPILFNMVKGIYKF